LNAGYIAETGVAVNWSRGSGSACVARRRRRPVRNQASTGSAWLWG